MMCSKFTSGPLPRPPPRTGACSARVKISWGFFCLFDAITLPTIQQVICPFSYGVAVFLMITDCTSNTSSVT